MSTEIIRIDVDSSESTHVERPPRNTARPGYALIHTTIDGVRRSPYAVHIGAVRAHVRRARTAHTVLEFDTTTRDRIALRVVHLRHAPGTWDVVEDVVDIYEIPMETLTAL